MAAVVGLTGRAIGIDGSVATIEESIKPSRDAGLAVEFRHADAHALPFSDNYFDACRVERTLQLRSAIDQSSVPTATKLPSFVSRVMMLPDRLSQQTRGRFA